ncbi:TonB-dependent receptor [uncultured Parabacteroides sp.]|uniref:SusC/RagA family TonB-linked outer membrane protein n=1 Tax=uncultured Parabacteroides sp. TaxID=512312 RepID=UPI00280613CF|nr:TonB-dependent receptor [uncultured Parabacteroides sp.]
MLKKTKLISLILLSGALAVPAGAFAEIAPFKQETNISQQNGKVSGVVEDALGPVAGASVVVKGTTNGSVTDMDGNFTLEGVNKGAIIQISFIGYVTQEIKYTGQPILKIDLKEDSQALEEVVVVGYGTQKKANLTGAVAQVAGDVLENRPIANIGQGLQGVVPNLNITVPSGAPGKGSEFNVRGTTSINGGSPLVLVNNVQMDANLVNPDDIASISVLKDAASSAIYGARAAYGVILITTKNGKKERAPQVSLSANGYWQSPAKRVHNVNSMDFLSMKDLAYQNSGGSGHYYHEAIYDYAKRYFNGTYDSPVWYDPNLIIDPSKPYDYNYCGNTDWFDELYKKASFSQMYNVNVSGGSEKTTYYASVGYNDVGGLLKEANDDYRKFNVNLNVSTDITKWLNVSAKVMHTYTKESHPSGGTTAMNNTAWSGISAYSGMMKNDLSPLMPVRHPDGHFAGQGGYTNPIALQAQGGNNRDKQNDLWMTGAIKITPLEGLVVNADYTFNMYNKGSNQHVQRFLEYKAVAGTEGYYPWTNPSSVVMANNEDYYTSFNAFAEYTKSFNDNTHNFKVMAGYNQEYKHTKYFWSGRTNLIDDSKPALNQAIGEMNMGYNESHWAINGFFFRLNYNYKQRYLFEVNGRYDGSSKFPDGDRYAFFPSVSAAWRISEEAFWEPVKGWWDDMKIRASYGSLGNQQTTDDMGNFPYLPQYGVTSSMGMILGGSRPVAISPSGLVSSSFTWETVNQVDVGFDATFLNNRLTAGFDWYRRDTKDMLTAGQALPSVLGASVPVENAADLKTVGWELSLGWNDRLENGFNYWVKGVLSDYQSTITKFANPTGSLFTKNKNNETVNQYYEGYKMNTIYGYSSNGLFQTDVEAAEIDQTQLYGGTWGAGDVRYVDLDGDGKITRGKNTLDDMGDQKIIGNSTPRYSYGFTAGFEYKGFDFEMFWQGIGKRDYMCGGNSFWGFTSEWDTPLTNALDYWNENNRDAYYPRPGWANGGNRVNSDRYLQNAAYLRLKNLTIGYTIPKNVLGKIGISRLRVYLLGENLLTFTPLMDTFDPETLNNMTYPISKKYSVGLNLTF